MTNIKYFPFQENQIKYKQSFADKTAKLSLSYLLQNITSLATDALVYIASFGSAFIWIFVCFSLLSLVNGQDDNDEGQLYKGTKLCSNGSKHGFVDGTFEYAYWDSVDNAPVYKTSTNIYLYPFTAGSTRIWHIHYNPDDNFAYGRCEVSGSDFFNIDDCINGWQSATTNGSWEEDIDMRLVNCTDICVKGNDKSWLNGVYIWKYFNRTINGSVYYCKECDSGTATYDGTYLYPFILPTNETNYSVWTLAGDLSLTAFFSACTVGKDLESDYVFNLKDCVAWITWDAETDGWVTDFNLTVQECKESPTTTAPPIRTPISIGTILWFIIALLVIMDVIIVAICIYYIQKKLLQRAKEPYNAPWITAIKQFGCFHFLGICMEIYDIGTDYTFSVDLILSPEPRDLTKVSLGWAALVISATGLILFVCKYMAIRKLVGKQIAKYRHQLKTTKNDRKREEIMEKIRIRMMDIDILSLFNGCIEDVPTTIIVLIVFTNYGFSITSILCITGNVVSFGLKVSTIIMGKYGCKDVTDDYDPTIQPLEDEKEGVKPDIVTIEGDNDGGFNHSTHKLLELQESVKM